MSEASPDKRADALTGRSRKHDPIMRLTARHMYASHSSTAPVSILADADATRLMALRRGLAEHQPAPRITLSTLLIKLVASALTAHPELNATFQDDVLTLHDEIDIGIATTRPDGNLIVPVLRGVGRKSVTEIATTAAELIAKVRAGRQRLIDVQGGGFTVSNIGMLPAVRYTTPLPNLPQVAILGVGAVSQVVALRNGVPEQRDRLGLSLTFDHRAMNGFAAGQFVQTLASMIADPSAPLGLADRDQRPATGTA